MAISLIVESWVSLHLICHFSLWSDQDFSNLPLNILGDSSQEPPPSFFAFHPPPWEVSWRLLFSLVPGPLLLLPSWEPRWERGGRRCSRRVGRAENRRDFLSVWLGRGAADSKQEARDPLCDRLVGFWDCLLHREMVYASRESSPTRRLNNLSPAPHLASGSPPPGLPSRAAFGLAVALAPLVRRGAPALPTPAARCTTRLSGWEGAPATRSVSPSPSAILERRDVKPGRGPGGQGPGGMVLVKGEGLYADPYGLLHEAA